MEGAEHFWRARRIPRALGRACFFGDASALPASRTACKGFRLLLALAAAVFLRPPAAHAASAFGIDEVKLGVLAHSLGGKEPGSVDLNGEILFVSPVPKTALSGVPLRPILVPFLMPRPDAGFDLNTAGKTSQVYFGLNWTWPLFRNLFQPGDAVDASFGFGPAFNNGLIRSPTNYRNSLGSNVLFHTSGEFSYRFSSGYEVSLYYEHVSNAGLARENEGQNDAGMRFGIFF